MSFSITFSKYLKQVIGQNDLKPIKSITLCSLIAAVLITSSWSMAQPVVITVNATGDLNTKLITIDRKIKQVINPDKNYQIEIVGVNSAHTNLKLSAKSKEIYTPLPEVLKTVLPGVTGSFLLSKALADDDEAFRSDLNTRINKLKKIKENADKLHDQTLFKSNTAKAGTYFDQIKNQYKGARNDNLSDFVSADIQYLIAVKTFMDNAMKVQPDLSLAEAYAQVTSISNELAKNDYLSLFDYIKRSKSATNSIKSKAFSGSKDLVELSIMLIDTYTKDTLANEMRTLYTEGGSTWGLGFSTGFFYTDVFSDTPYFLKARSDENVAVLADQRIKFDISIGGLGHLYYKASPSFRIGPSVGIAVSPFDGKSRYLLGGSVLIGKEKMIGISVGRAWAKVKKLSASVSTDTQGKFLPKGTTAIPTYDSIGNGWFFGLTYNLLSTRK